MFEKLEAEYSAIFRRAKPLFFSAARKAVIGR
jgi:hypothetical protein